MNAISPREAVPADLVFKSLNEYMSVCNRVVAVAGHEGEKDQLQKWIYGTVSDNAEIARDLMHDSPLRTVTRFLGVEPTSEAYAGLFRLLVERADRFALGLDPSAELYAAEAT